MKLINMQAKSASTFDYQGVYPCPVCRLGELNALALMDAMACNFCSQIFTANLEKQELKMPSRQPPLVWRWDGRNWTGAHLEGVELSWSYWLAAGAFVFIPPTLIGLATYAFPPTPNTPLSWLPYVWTGLGFFSHLGIMGWLAIEFYEFPVETYLRVIRQRLLGN